MNGARLDLGGVPLGEGGDLLLTRALARVEVGAPLVVVGGDATLAVDLPAWCRGRGHRVVDQHADAATLVRGAVDEERWRGATRAGQADPAAPGAVVDHPPTSWGLAARGALVEAGGAGLARVWTDKDEVWSDDAARLYAQAAAAQWDPASAIPWAAPLTHDDEVEDAVVQVMTYLIENETAALLVPTRFLAGLHPHFREVMQLLAIQAADEARHIDVVTRRAMLRRSQLGTSTVGGQASLASLFAEPDFAVASFLLAVLGEGSFLVLLAFLRDHGPDPVTRAVAQLAGQDEARHVAFGLSHLGRHLARDPDLAGRLAAAAARRHGALAERGGLNPDVFTALVVVAAGSWRPAAIRRGHALVRALVDDMDRARRGHLVRLGFGPEEAAAISSLHTANFM